MRDDKVAERILEAEGILGDLKRDFRTGYVMAARRKADALAVIAKEIEEAIRVASGSVA